MKLPKHTFGIYTLPDFLAIFNLLHFVAVVTMVIRVACAAPFFVRHAHAQRKLALNAKTFSFIDFFVLSIIIDTYWILVYMKYISGPYCH